VAIVAAVLFLALATLVATRVADPVDEAVRDWFSPNGGWGTRQELADRVGGVLDPRLLALAAVAAAGVLSARARSLTPLLLVVTVVIVAAGVEVGVKWLMPRIAAADPGARSAGGFPSGHMTAAVGFCGAVVCCLPRGRRAVGWLAVGALSTVVAAALLVASIHYLSDVLGGALLSAAVLGAATSAFAPPDRTRSGRRPVNRDTGPDARQRPDLPKLGEHRGADSSRLPG
jgi:undecaprenyl-diphosphatase